MGLVATIALGSGCSVISALHESPCSDDQPCVDAFGPGAACGDAGLCVLPTVASGQISEDTTWDHDHNWLLDGIVHVDATLTIEPGTVIRGNPGSAIVVSPSGSLEAVGDPGAPIVFTSATAPGSRQPGDWGGLALFGLARVDGQPPLVSSKYPDAPEYGGSDDAHRCGRLEYVRVEFSGQSLVPGEDLSSLVLAGCGSDTVVDHVQVHRTLDDGLTLIGGDVDVRSIVVTGASDDSLAWEAGWRGRAQFLILQQYPNVYGGGQGELKGKGESSTGLESNPLLYNVSALGSGDREATEEVGFIAEYGTEGQLYDVLFAHQGFGAVDVRDAATVARVQEGTLSIAHSALWASGLGEAWAADGSKDTDGGFSESDWLSGNSPYYPDPANELGLDPGTADPPAPGPSPWLTERLAESMWTPPLGSTVASIGIAPPIDGFFVPTTYAGAVAPNGSAWWNGWTDFPDY